MSESAEEQRSAVDRVIADLRNAGATGEVVHLTVDVPTAATAAAELGCEVGAIANSLIFRGLVSSPDGHSTAGEEPVLILASGAHRVDTKLVARQFGLPKLKRADPEFVHAATGQRVGGVAPVGHPQRLRTFVDNWLQKYDTVWAAGGEAHTVFPTSFDELVRLTGGTPADVAKD